MGEAMEAWREKASSEAKHVIWVAVEACLMAHTGAGGSDRLAARLAKMEHAHFISVLSSVCLVSRACAGVAHAASKAVDRGMHDIGAPTREVREAASGCQKVVSEIW